MYKMPQMVLQRGRAIFQCVRFILYPTDTDLRQYMKTFMCYQGV